MGRQKLEQKTLLNLTPQQIQFLNLLQTPLIALEKSIEKELEENPALEEDLEKDTNEEEEINSSFITISKTKDLNTVNIEDKQTSLAEHLIIQLTTLNVNEDMKFLVHYLINSLDDNGFLNRDLYSISSDLLINNQLDVKEDQLLKALKILQGLDPCGVGARNLKECLLIQLQTIHPEEKNALLIIRDYYTAFTNKNFEKIKASLCISSLDLKNIYILIESLNPIPGSGFSQENINIEYIVADFNVFIKNNTPEVTLNKSSIKSLTISNYYKKLLEETTDKETKLFLKEKIEKAIWFKDSLLKREKTLKKIMSAIVKLQEAYFISGIEKDLLPMKLADIAQIVNMDISTISRFSNAKYVETHFGTFKLKELFSEAYRKDNGEVISTKEIKSALKDIVKDENKMAPYTDEELSEILSKQEYHIARRTVSKYRENMNIPIAKMRKKL